jgi:Arc/MetJ family transcription regulator
MLDSNAPATQAVVGEFLPLLVRQPGTHDLAERDQRSLISLDDRLATRRGARTGATGITR